MIPPYLEAVEEAIAAIEARCPFESSFFERSAEDVYTHGLHSAGGAGYESLDDALQDWRAGYNLEVRGMAQVLVETKADRDAVNWVFGWAMAEVWQPPAVAEPKAQAPEKSWATARKCSAEDFDAACESYARRMGWR